MKDAFLSKGDASRMYDEEQLTLYEWVQRKIREYKDTKYLFERQ
jgi:hypothetical protein